MNFDSLAKDLLKDKKSKQESPLERANVLFELSKNGFGVQDICSELRYLYDQTDDSGIKKQILDMVLKVQGLYKDEEKKETPKIIFNFLGDPQKLNAMLCPPVGDAA